VCFAHWVYLRSVPFSPPTLWILLSQCVVVGKASLDTLGALVCSSMLPWVSWSMKVCWNMGLTCSNIFLCLWPIGLCRAVWAVLSHQHLVPILGLFQASLEVELFTCLHGVCMVGAFTVEAWTMEWFMFCSFEVNSGVCKYEEHIIGWDVTNLESNNGN